ncbi:MAG: chemotaxis protein CheB, partial [bacterium]|nr:chemotaxis protein CheB [bacterium]
NLQSKIGLVAARGRAKNRFKANKIEKVVVIGSSAGGIDALMQVLPCLPANLEAAVLVAQHMKAGRWTRMPEHFGRYCNLPVFLAEEGMALETGVVYIAEPGN